MDNIQLIFLILFVSEPKRPVERRGGELCLVLAKSVLMTSISSG